MLGRAEGTGKGKGGPMHVSWPGVGLMLTTGVVGSGLPIAAGLAWAACVARARAASPWCRSATAPPTSVPSTKPPTWPRCGDFPVVFLCQNNGYGEHTAFADHLRVEHVAQRAAAYGMPGRDRGRQRPRGGVRGGGRAVADGPGPGRGRPWSRRSPTGSSGTSSATA